jgi:hypothetical protein
VVSEEAPDPNTVPRGWWRYNEGKAEGLKTSILVIRGLLMTQRFDVRVILATCIIDLSASFMLIAFSLIYYRESLDLGAIFCSFFRGCFCIFTSSQGGAFAAVIAALVCSKSSCPGFFGQHWHDLPVGASPSLPRIPSWWKITTCSTVIPPYFIISFVYWSTITEISASPCPGFGLTTLSPLNY